MSKNKPFLILSCSVRICFQLYKIQELGYQKSGVAVTRLDDVVLKPLELFCGEKMEVWRSLIEDTYNTLEELNIWFQGC